MRNITCLLYTSGFREHDRQEEELLERRYERCKREYDKEKAKLDELYRQKEQARREADVYKRQIRSSTVPMLHICRDMDNRTG